MMDLDELMWLPYGRDKETGRVDIGITFRLVTGVRIFAFTLK